MNSTNALCNAAAIPPIASEFVSIEREPNGLPDALAIYPQNHRGSTLTVPIARNIHYIGSIAGPPSNVWTVRGPGKLLSKGNISVCCEAFVQSFRGQRQL
jgi:hypothetical protein